VLQPIAELTAIAHEHGVLLHTGAAQAVGKLPSMSSSLTLTCSPSSGTRRMHPRALARSTSVRASASSHLFVAAARSMAFEQARKHRRIAGADLIEEGNRLRALRNRIHQRLIDRLPGRMQLNGHRVQRLPNTLNVTITGLRSDNLLSSCPQIAGSTGSACHTGNPEPSPVLSAMRHDADRALGALRLTLGRWTSQAEVDQATDHIADAGSARSNGDTHEWSRH
jgi:cysteine desulfurase